MLSREDIGRIYVAGRDDLFRLAWLAVGAPGAAEDLVQEAYTRLWAHPERVRDAAKVDAYVRSIVLNLARSRFNRRSRRNRLAARVGDDRTGAACLPEPDPMRGADDRAIVADALESLSGNQRICVVCRYWLGLTDAELAEFVEIVESVDGMRFVTFAGAHYFAQAEHIPPDDESHVTTVRVVQTRITAIGDATLLPDPDQVNPTAYEKIAQLQTGFRHGGIPTISPDGVPTAPISRQTPIWLVELHSTGTCSSGEATCEPAGAPAPSTAFSVMRLQPPAGTDPAQRQTITTGVDGDVDLDLAALGPVGTWTVN